MTVLVSGGAGSGKSAFAEQLVSQLAREETCGLLYVAAMEPFGEEAAVRIARHRAQRRGLGFMTVERYRDLAGLAVPPDRAVLLEDLGNLCANELFEKAEGKPDSQAECAFPRAESAVLAGIEHLRTSCRHLVVVTNEVFSGGEAYAGGTDAWLRLLARVNRRTAALSDGVCEVVCGVPCWYRDLRGLSRRYPSLTGFLFQEIVTGGRQPCSS